jgi:hypothetical protein
MLPLPYPSLGPTPCHSSLFSSLPPSLLFLLLAQMFSFDLKVSFSHKHLCSGPERGCSLNMSCSPFLLVLTWVNFLSSSSVLSDHYSSVTMPVVLDHTFISNPLTLNNPPKCEQHHAIPRHPNTGSISQRHFIIQSSQFTSHSMAQYLKHMDMEDLVMSKH